MSSYKVLTSTAIHSCFGLRVTLAAPPLAYSISFCCKSGFGTLFCLLLPSKRTTYVRNKICHQNLQSQRMQDVALPALAV